MAQTFFPITPTEIVSGVPGDWADMDASALIPVGATGVILHIVNTGINRDLGLRKNGSSDNRTREFYGNMHCWPMIGVDGSRIFEAKVAAPADFDIYVVGYTKAGVTFLTNASDKSLTSTGTWRDISCSAQAPNAIGLIFELHLPSISYKSGFRKNGSSDDRKDASLGKTNFSAVIGCDESQIAEGWIDHLSQDFYLIGYITDGVTFNLNAANLSLGTAEEWLDLPALPDENPIMGIIEVFGNNLYGLRKNGSAEDLYYQASHPWAIVECVDRIIEGKIATTNVDFFLIGYAIAPPAVGLENKSANMGSKMVAAGLI